MNDVAAISAPRVSVVIPLLNEAENLLELHRRLRGTLEEMPGSFEVILTVTPSAVFSTFLSTSLSFIGQFAQQPPAIMP